MEYLGNLKNTVANALSTNTPSPTISKSDVLGLEEGERSRRITQVSQTKVDKQNAANVSGLITSTRFPVFRGNVSKGYKRVTTRFEEDERRRRLTNKSESALRRANANKTSRMIQEMGWPFYQQNHSGAEYVVMDPTKLLEEEEREWRTSDSYWGPTAKHNAAMVANILRWGNFKLRPHTGFKQHTKFLEEKERKDRLNNMESSMQNAYKEAGLIKKMGPPFYVQESTFTPAKRDYSEINRLEELERKRRMMNPEEQQLAHELAGIIKNEQGLGAGAHDAESEEQERRRRIADKKSQNIAKQNAKQVSLMVRESSQNKINGAGPMWFSISRNSMRALEEVERTRRLRDIEGQRWAKQHAKLVSDMISGRTLAPAKPSINAIEEDERQSRMHDRQSQQLRIKNARRVSGLIARHMLMSSGSRDFALALEESERARRINDANQQSLAKDNARKVSNLVSSLSVAPGNKMAALPSPTAALPTYSAPVAASPIKVDIKETPRSAAPLIASPLVQQQPLSSSSELKPTSPLVAAAPSISKAPISPMAAPIAAPISAAPISAAPISAAPISAAPISAAPISAAPVVTAPKAAPIAPSVAPVSAAPVSSAPIVTAPKAAPIAPSVAPISSTPISSAPVSSAPISSGAVYSAPVPIPAPTTRAAPLSGSSPIIQHLVLPTTSAPVPVAPLATAGMPVRSASSNLSSSNPISAAPIYTSPIPSSIPVSSTPLSSSIPLAASAPMPTVPVDNAAIAHAALGDRERKRILKQANKHNKKSEKDVRKAEASMLKAEKMHQKGRDNKALKLEGKAERFMKNAEHERRWASGLQGEISPNAPAPASM